MSKWREDFWPDVIYVVESDDAEDMYCVTPDGVGAFWYESDEELYAAYGAEVFTNFPVVFITMRELEALRGWR